MKIKIQNNEYDFTLEEFNRLKSKLSSRKYEYKEIGLVDVAVYAGNLFLGYINIQLAKRFLREFRKI